MDNLTYDEAFEDVDLQIRRSYAPAYGESIQQTVVSDVINSIDGNPRHHHVNGGDAADGYTNLAYEDALPPSINGSHHTSSNTSDHVTGLCATPAASANIMHSGRHLGFSDDSFDHVIDGDALCGFGLLHPICVKRFTKMGYFTFFYAFAGMVTSALSVYMSSQITTIEKHFNFSSSFSGFLLSCNDLGYLTTTLIMSYYARRVHIPRALALATFLFGLSGLLCTVSFFMTQDKLPSPPNNAEDIELEHIAFTQLCEEEIPLPPDSNSTVCLQTKALSLTNIDTNLKNFALFFLVVGMMLQGMSRSPKRPFLATYVDDNVPKIKSAWYLGIINGCSTLGPSIAFALGGLFSRFYVTLEATNMSVRDPRWIGAWWLGFFLFGSSALVVALPIACFPKSLRGHRMLEGVDSGGHDEYKLKTGHKRKQKKSKVVVNDIKGFGQSLRRLVTTPVYILIVLAHSTNEMAMDGFLSFQPKYLETQFIAPSWYANLVIGTLTVSAAVMGTVVGGYLTTKLKLTPMACLRAYLAATVISTMALGLAFVFGCDQPYIETGELVEQGVTFFTDPCVDSCNCNTEEFFPVCGADNINYYSPCHAGCTSMQSRDFLHCHCLSLNGSHYPKVSPDRYHVTTVSDTSWKVTAGLCESTCGYFNAYIAAEFIMTFVGTLGIMPGFMVIIRSISEEDKPLAVGLNAFINTLLGFCGPVMFGVLIDTTCKMWSTTCQGGCALYNLRDFRVRYHGLWILLRTMNCALIIAAYLIVVFSDTFRFQENEDEKRPSVSSGCGDDAKRKTTYGTASSHADDKAMSGEGAHPSRISGLSTSEM